MKEKDIIYVTDGVKDIRNKTQYQHSEMLIENHTVVTISQHEVAPFVEEDSQAIHCFSDHPVPSFLFPYWGIIVALSYFFIGYDTVYTTHSPQCLILGILTVLPGVQWVADIWDDPRLGQQIGHYNNDVRTGILPEKPYSKILVLVSIKILRHCDILILSISDEIVMEWPVTIPRSKILTTTNGIDLEYTQAAAKDITEKESNDTPPLDVLYVGHVGRVRGLDTLIKAMDELSERSQVDVRLSLVGSIADKDQVWLENQLEECDIEHVVEICGYLEHQDALRKIAGSNICINILPQEVGNYRYAFPIKIFEYMSFGKPIVSTKTEGITKLLRDGHSAVLLPENGPNIVADAIEQLANDPELRRKIGKNAEQNVNQYDWTRIRNTINREISEL